VEEGFDVVPVRLGHATVASQALHQVHEPVVNLNRPTAEDDHTGDLRGPAVLLTPLLMGTRSMRMSGSAAQVAGQEGI
jgi:hypothetical protein